MARKTFSEIEKEVEKMGASRLKNNKEKKSFEDLDWQDGSFNWLKRDFENQIGFDSYAKDLEATYNQVKAVDSGWQNEETIDNTLDSLRNIRERNNAYNQYMKIFNPEAERFKTSEMKIDEIIDAVKDKAELYGKYKGEGSYNYEQKQLKKLYSMSSKDIEPYLGNEDKAVAHTTVDGYQIKWQDLYDEAAKSEFEKNALEKYDVESLGKYTKASVEYTRNVLTGYSDVPNKDYDKFIYNIVNGDTQALAVMGSHNKNNKLYIHLEKYENLTDEEKKIYNSICKQDGYEKGTEYLYLMANILEKRDVEAEAAYWAKAAKEAPFTTSLYSVGQNVSNAFTGWMPLLADAMDGEINPNSPYYSGSRTVNTIRGTIENDVIDSDIGQFLYRHGMNIADNVAMMAVSGGGTMGKVSKAIQSTLMSSQAFTQTTIDAKQRGLSDEKALGIGAIAGGAEYFFESKSFDALFGKGSIGKGAGGYLLDNIKTEVVGELGTELTNDVADFLIAQDFSQWKISIDGYVASGMSESEALSKTITDYALKYVDIAGGTVLSSGAMAGPSAVGMHFNNKFTGRDLRESGQTSAVFDMASISPEASQAYEAYTRYAKRGINADNIKDAQLGTLYNTMNYEAQEGFATANRDIGKAKKTIERQQFLRDVYTEDDVRHQNATNKLDKAIAKQTDAQKRRLGSAETMKKLSGIEKGMFESQLNKAVEKAEAKRIKSEEQERAKHEAEVKKLSSGVETSVMADSETAVNIKGAVFDGDRITSIVTDNGDVAFKDVELSDKDTDLLLRSRGIAKENPNLASLYVEHYDGNTDIEAYTNAFNLVTEYAKNDFSYDHILRNKGVLSGEQVSAIYTATRIKADKEKTNAIEKATEKQAGTLPYQAKIDNSIFDFDGKGTEGKVDWNSLDTMQKRSVALSQALSMGVGFDLVLEANKKYNGKFNMSTKTMYLDVFAKKRVEGEEYVRALIPTLAHELTHPMEELSPELWREMNEIVFKTLYEHDGIDEETRIELEKKAHKGKTLTDKEARGEIIARACEDILKYSKEGKKMFASLSENEQKTFVGKIKELLNNLLEWVEELLELYESTSYEARVMKQYQEEIQKLAEYWDKALVEMKEINKAQKAEKNTVEADDVRMSEKITIGMSDAERYEILKNRVIVLAKTDTELYNKYLEQMPGLLDEKIKKTDAKKLLKKIGNEFGVFAEYENKDFDIRFEFGKNNLEESVNKQKGNYGLYAQMLSCFSDVISNAVGIEAHNRNEQGYKVDLTLKSVYVFCSAFENDTDIVPVKLSVKEFLDKENRLYVAVALESIKKDRVVSMGVQDNLTHIRTSPATISIQDIFKNVNTKDGDFLKYIPDGFLSTDQIKAKRAALGIYENPTEHEDIRFSMSDNVEETKDLVAVHNLREEQVVDALKRGQFTMPSIAVTNKGHTDFGEVSVVFNKDTIDPSLNADNRLYGSDAWTPTQTNIKKNPVFDNDAVSNVLKDVKRTIGNGFSQLFDVSRSEFKDALTKADGSIYDAFSEDVGMQTAYAMKNGIIKKLPKVDGKIDTNQLKSQLDATLGKDAEWRNYKNWLEGISDSVITSYDNATNDDILNNMKAQPDTAKEFKLGENGELTVPAVEYNSIEEYRQNKSRLSEDADEMAKAVGQSFVEWANGIAENTNVALGDVVGAINNSFDSRYHASDIVSTFADKGVTITRAEAKALQSLYKQAVELPTKYFEAKPQRAVGLDEIASVIIPADSSKELKNALVEKNIPYIEYDNGNNNSRLDALNSIEDIRFADNDDVDYSRVREMQIEINSITEQLKSIENSEEYKSLIDSMFDEGGKESFAERYEKWLKGSGYSELKNRRTDLEKELGELNTKIKADYEKAELDKERKAIEKSGLSEADYFRKQAVKEFGYTPYFYDAGYITPNGKMLNFSGEKGRHFGSRGQDHRAIGIIYANVDGSQAMIKFMGEGNIRIMAESPGIDISSMVAPTSEQYSTIRKFAREYANEGYFNIDFTNADGQTVANYEYDGKVNPDRIVNDIKYYFENGTTREQSTVAQFRYSDKDDSSVYDIVGEKDRLIKENESLKADVERLVERLKLERQVTHGNYFNENQVSAVAGHLLNISKSDYSKKNLMTMLNEFYSFIASSEQLTWEDVYSRSYYIAKAMLNEARPEVVKDDRAKMILKDLRKRRISLSDMQKAEAEYAFGKNWQRRFFNKVIIANDGLSLDSQWQEWAEIYPEWFDSDTNSNDQIIELYNILNDLRDSTETIVEYDAEEQARWLANEIYNSYWNVSTIKTTADRYDKKIKQLNFEHRKAMSKLRDDYKARTDEKVKSAKTLERMFYGRKLLEKDKEIAKQKLADDMFYGRIINRIKTWNQQNLDKAKNRGYERLSMYKENAERRTKIQSITANALDLNDKLLKNSKDKHIPEVMKGAVEELLQAIDFSSKRLLEGGEPTQKDISLQKALGHLKDAITDGSQEVGDILDEMYGSGIDDLTKELVKSVDKAMSEIREDGSYTVNEMSLEDLQKLDTIVKIVKRTVNRVNKFHVAHYNAGVQALGVRSAEEIDSRKKIFKDNKKHFEQMKTKLYWNNLNPYYAFKNLGGAAQTIFTAIQDGQDKLAFLSKEVIDKANEIYTAKEYNKWKDTFFDFEIAQPNGKVAKFQMNVPQIMSLYCVTKQEDARKHILYGNENGEGGGITIVETDKTEAVRRNIRLTEDNLKTIIDKLNDKNAVGKAKEVADKLQEYMGTRGAELGNEISMARWGIKSFGIENYFPIKVSDGSVPKKNDTPGIDSTSMLELLNMSFTKSRNHFAKQSVEIGDVFDVFANHMSNMVRYNAMALPILDMYKWMNCRGTDEYGVEFSIQTSTRDTFGDHAWSYFNTFLKDISGATKKSTRDNLLVKFFKNAKVAKVAANMRVALLQFTSYTRAGAVIDNKYLFKALSHKPKISKAEENCGIALWKSFGYFDTDISRGLSDQIKHTKSVKDKIVEGSLKGAEWADKVTWGYLWTACELEIRDTRKDLKVGSDEFNKAIALRLRDVIYRTQVVDSMLTRSQMMRSPDGWDKMLTTFASENTLSLNMAMDIFASYELDKRSMGKETAKAKNKKYMRKAITAYIVTNIVTSALQSVFDAFRDYDEDEKDEEYWMKLMLTNFVSNSSVVAKTPIGNALASVAQGFTPARMDVDWMNSMVKTGKEVYKLFTGEGSTEKAIKNFLKTASDSSGIAAYNVYRDIYALYEMFADD